MTSLGDHQARQVELLQRELEIENAHARAIKDDVLLEALERCNLGFDLYLTHVLKPKIEAALAV